MFPICSLQKVTQSSSEINHQITHVQTVFVIMQMKRNGAGNSLFSCFKPEEHIAHLAVSS